MSYICERTRGGLRRLLDIDFSPIKTLLLENRLFLRFNRRFFFFSPRRFHIPLPPLIHFFLYLIFKITNELLNTRKISIIFNFNLLKINELFKVSEIYSKIHNSIICFSYTSTIKLFFFFFSMKRQPQRRNCRARKKGHKRDVEKTATTKALSRFSKNIINKVIKMRTN